MNLYKTIEKSFDSITDTLDNQDGLRVLNSSYDEKIENNSEKILSLDEWEKILLSELEKTMKF